jgi:hypothetical protein
LLIRGFTGRLQPLLLCHPSSWIPFIYYGANPYAACGSTTLELRACQTVWSSCRLFLAKINAMVHGIDAQDHRYPWKQIEYSTCTATAGLTKKSLSKPSVSVILTMVTAGQHHEFRRFIQWINGLKATSRYISITKFGLDNPQLFRSC